MHNFALNFCGLPVHNPAHKLGNLYTNTQPARGIAVMHKTYAPILAQFIYSVVHTKILKSYLLHKVVHTFPRPYNYYYLYKVNRKEVTK